MGDDLVARVVRDKKFGDEISDSSFRAAFREQAIDAYKELAAGAAPLQFAGDWRTALRTVPTWKRNPESEDIWLAVEDYGSAGAGPGPGRGQQGRRQIQAAQRRRSPRTTNPGRPGRTTRGSGLRRPHLAAGPQADRRAGVPAVEGSLTNLTPRLQPFNAANELVFNVYLSDDPDARPFRFAVEGTTLEGGKTEPITYVKKKHKVLEGRAVELVRVEQVFDVRTAPVKRIDKVALGELSSRQKQAELQMPAFGAKAVEGREGGLRRAAGRAERHRHPMPGGGRRDAVGVGRGRCRGGRDFTYNGRPGGPVPARDRPGPGMPVGLVVVADQGYVQDVLTALSNSKLRFQEVQTTLAGFRGTLRRPPEHRRAGPPAGHRPEEPGRRQRRRDGRGRVAAGSAPTMPRPGAGLPTSPGRAARDVGRLPGDGVPGHGRLADEQHRRPGRPAT